MTQRVAVIDYGMGNLHSVASALEHVGATEVVVSHEPQSILDADRVVFPGVGGIRDCMEAIRRLGCDQLLDQVLSVDRKPVLAICVGMQALMSRSEENGGVACLDVLPGKVAFFGEAHQSDDGERLKVPHMGWNNVKQLTDHPVWHGIKDDARFYFVHSYFVDMSDPNEVIGRCDYGQYFAATFARDNLVAAQFHPEKSHLAGLRFLRNFLQWQVLVDKL